MSTSNQRCSTANYDVSEAKASVQKEVQALQQAINLQTHTVCSEAPTILITNYAHNNGTVKSTAQSHCTKTNLNPTGSSSSSITIYTHNSDSESSAANLAAPSINILINNHFDRPLVESVSTTSKNDGMHAPLMAIKIEKTEEDVGRAKAATETVADEGTSNGWSSKKFSIGHDVLVKRDDGRIYLGTIVEVRKTKCLVKYDDNSIRWSDFGRITNLDVFEDDAKPVCIVCKQTDKTNEIVNTCDACCRTYHEKCMNGEVTKTGAWHCKRCITDKISSIVKETNSLCEKPKLPKLGNSAKNQLPYDVSCTTQCICCRCLEFFNYFFHFLFSWDS